MSNGLQATITLLEMEMKDATPCDISPLRHIGGNRYEGDVTVRARAVYEIDFPARPPAPLPPEQANDNVTLADIMGHYTDKLSSGELVATELNVYLPGELTRSFTVEDGHMVIMLTTRENPPRPPRYIEQQEAHDAT